MNLLLFEFADRSLLWGLALAAIPVIFYLLDRRRTRPVDWAAVQFFGDWRRTLRWMRLRELFLVAIRCAVLGAAALLLARPQGEVEVAVTPESAGRQALVLAIDNTPSMALEDAEGSRIARARDLAAALVDRLHPGDEILIIPLSPDPDAPAAALSQPFKARERIFAVPIGPPVRSGLDLLEEAVLRSQKLLAPLRRIVVLTDLQSCAWPLEEKHRLEALRERTGALSPRPEIAILDLGRPPAENLALIGLELARPLAGTDSPAGIIASLRRFQSGSKEAPVNPAGPAAGGRVQVTLSVDGEAVESKTVELQEGRTAAVRFEHRFLEPGTHQIEAAIPPDALPLDDRRFLSARVAERIPVLLVEDFQTEKGMDSEAGLLQLALAPQARGQAAPRVLFKPRRIFTRELEEVDPRDYRVLIFAGVAELPASWTRALEESVHAGAGALFFAGPKTSIAGFSEGLFRAGKGLLPAEPIEAVRPGDRSAAAPEGFDFSHPALALFSDPKNGDLSRLEIRGWLALRPEGKQSRVLARLSGGQVPFLLEKPFGRGRVLLAATSAHRRDSNLPLQPFFLPLLHTWAGWLAAQGEPPLNFTAGEPIPIETSAGETGPLAVEGPDGRTAEVKPFGQTPERAEAGSWRFDGASLSGFYSLKAGPRKLAVYAANYPASESDPAPLDEQGRELLASRLGIQIAGSLEELAGVELRTVQLRPYWRWLLGLAAGLLAAEILLSRRLSRDQLPFSSAKAEAEP